MDFTETQQEILATRALLAREGKGQVIEDGAFPDAHALAEAGWLERRFQPDGETRLVLDTGRPRAHSTSARCYTSTRDARTDAGAGSDYGSIIGCSSPGVSACT